SNGVFNWNINWARFNSLLITSFPLGCTALVGALFTSFPRIAISSHAGLVELGVFTALMSLLVAYNIVVNSFVQSAMSDLAKSYINNPKEFMQKIAGAAVRIAGL